MTQNLFGMKVIMQSREWRGSQFSKLCSEHSTNFFFQKMSINFGFLCRYTFIKKESEEIFL